MKKLLILSLLLIAYPAFADLVCDTSVSDYVALYTVNTYTCASGQYLPANTEGCRACPNGLTCPGGTFDFNANEYQGLISGNAIGNDTLNNVCADNFETDFYAIYKPNIININWDNGDSTTTTTTCEYDGTITLPLEPTRPGYTFSGWRLKTE